MLRGKFTDQARSSLVPLPQPPAEQLHRVHRQADARHKEFHGDPAAFREHVAIALVSPPEVVSAHDIASCQRVRGRFARPRRVIPRRNAEGGFRVIEGHAYLDPVERRSGDRAGARKQDRGGLGEGQQQVVRRSSVIAAPRSPAASGLRQSLSYQAVELKAGTLPAPPHRALIDPEQLGDLRLRPVVVEHQPDHLVLLGRQLSDRLVEASPQFKFLAVVRPVRGLGQTGAAAVVRGVRQGKPGEAVAGEAAGQVEQLPTNMLRCQVEEMAGRFGTKVVQRVQQADQAALEHIKGFGPLADVGEIPQHQPRQPLQMGPPGAQQLVPGVTVPSLPALHAALQPQGVQRGFAHGSRLTNNRCDGKQTTSRTSLIVPAGPSQTIAGELLSALPETTRKVLQVEETKASNPKQERPAPPWREPPQSTGPRSFPCFAGSNSCSVPASPQQHSAAGRGRPPRVGPASLWKAWRAGSCRPSPGRRVVLTAPDVQPLYLGSDWSQSSYSSQVTYLNGFVSNIVQSTYLPMLGEAGYTAAGSVPIGKGAYETGKIDSVALNKSQVLTDAQIQKDVQAEITNGTLKSPGSQDLYIVYVEDNVAVGLSNGVDSNGDGPTPGGFFGYHGAFGGKNASGQATDIHYAVICFPGGTVGNANNLTWLTTNGIMTQTTSHELAEAATDPNVNYKTLGWYDNANGEVGDIVNGQTVYLNGYAVQRIADPNDQPMIPAVATALNPVSFVLETNGTLLEYSASGHTTIATGVASVSDQGIDDAGQAMVDYVTTSGNAYEYHVVSGGYAIWLGSGIKSAVAGEGVSYYLTTANVLKEYKDANYAYGESTTTLETLAPGATLSAGTDLHGVNMVYVLTSSVQSRGSATVPGTPAMTGFPLQGVWTSNNSVAASKGPGRS